MTRKLSPALAVFLLASLLFAAATLGGEGTAMGRLTVGGKTTPLTHSYALARKDTFDKGKENILIVLSDAAIPEETLWDDFPGLKLALAGQLHAVEVQLASDKSVTSGGIAHEAFTESQGYFGTASPEFRAKTFNGTLVEGKLFSGEPQELNKLKAEYSATFRAPILHRPPPTATGAAAAQTAPGKAVLAFLKAAAAGNKASLKRLMSAEYGKPLNGPTGKAIVAQWKTSHADPIASPIDTVYITGNSAEVVLSDKSTGTMAAKFSLVLVRRQWRIDGAMM
jgi:hypothetical protein